MTAQINKIFRSINPWHFIWIIILATELFTLILNSLQSYIRWGYVSQELIEIGVIDAFIVSLFASPPIIYFFKDANDKLTHDIAERKRIENNLIERESQLSESQRVAKIGSWSWDIVNNTLDWSDEAFRRFDKDPETFTPTVEYFVSLIHPDDKASIEKAMQDTLINDTTYHIQPRIINENGRQWVLEGYGIVERDVNGTPLRFAGTVQDITERNTAEMKLRESQALLQTVIETAPT